MNEMVEIPKPHQTNENAPRKARKRDRHLAWYERQFGSGLILGLQLGFLFGWVTAYPLYAALKWLVNLFM